jgi:hypothetical protein
MSKNIIFVLMYHRHNLLKPLPFENSKGSLLQMFVPLDPPLLSFVFLFPEILLPRPHVITLLNLSVFYT